MSAMNEKSQMYADMFTFACFLVFGYHFVGICYISFDPDVAFFIGRWQLLCILCVPYLFIIHYFHQRIGRPSRSLMMAYTFPTAAVFFLVAWTMLFRAQRISMLLRSAECTRAPELHELHVGALAAREFHKTCLEQAKPEYKLIQYCAGYEEALKDSDHQRAWEYLFYAEHNYGCSGFCNEAAEPAMWTYQGYQDTCAVAVSNTMESKVASLCHQMIFVDVMIVICFMCWNEIMSATLRAVEKGDYHPQEWGNFAETARTEKSYGAAPVIMGGPPMGGPPMIAGPPVFQGAPPRSMPPPGTMPPSSFQPAPYVR